MDIGFTSARAKKIEKGLSEEAEKGSFYMAQKKRFGEVEGARANLTIKIQLQEDIPVHFPTILRCSGDERGETSVIDASQLRTLQLIM